MTWSLKLQYLFWLSQFIKLHNLMTVIQSFYLNNAILLSTTQSIWQPNTNIHSHQLNEHWNHWGRVSRWATISLDLRVNPHPGPVDVHDSRFEKDTCDLISDIFQWREAPHRSPPPHRNRCKDYARHLIFKSSV